MGNQTMLRGPLTTLPGPILSSCHSCPATRSQDWSDSPSRNGGTIDPFILQKNKSGLRATESRGTTESSDKEAIDKRRVPLRPDTLADPALVSLHLLPCEVRVKPPTSAVRFFGPAICQGPDAPADVARRGCGAARRRGMRDDVKRRQRCWGCKMTTSKRSRTRWKPQRRWGGARLRRLDRSHSQSQQLHPVGPGICTWSGSQSAWGPNLAHPRCSDSCTHTRRLRARA